MIMPTSSKLLRTRHLTRKGIGRKKAAPMLLALSAIKDILDYKRFCNLPLGLVLKLVNVLIYNRLINGQRLS